MEIEIAHGLFVDCGMSYKERSERLVEFAELRSEKRCYISSYGIESLLGVPETHIVKLNQRHYGGYAHEVVYEGCAFIHESRVKVGFEVNSDLRA